MTTGTKSTRRRPIISGLAVVLTAAAVLSFETLDKLGKGVGYTATFSLPVPFTGASIPMYLSWLFPLSVDAFGFLATIVWLTPAFAPPIRDFAKLAALGDLAASAALNALYHGMKAAGWEISTTTGVVIGVGALPPVMVFLSLHLGALVMDHDSASTPAEDAVVVASEAPAESASEAVAVLPDPAEVWAAIDAAEAPEAAPAKRFSRPLRKQTQKHPAKRASEAPTSASEKRSLTDEEAADLLVEKHPKSNPSKREARPLLRVHHDRLENIFQLADQKRSEKHLHLVQPYPADAAAAAN